MSYVLSVVSSLREDQWQFGTIGDKPKSDIHSRIKNFVGSSKAQEAIHSAASSVFGAVKHHHKHLLTTALAMSLSHVAPHHADVVLNTDTEHLIHHEIEHLSNNLRVTKGAAHHMLTHAVSKLKSMRGLQEANGYKGKDDEFDAILNKLHEVLKKIEPQYRDGRKDKVPSSQPPKPSKD